MQHTPGNQLDIFYDGDRNYLVSLLTDLITTHETSEKADEKLQPAYHKKAASHY